MSEFKDLTPEERRALCTYINRAYNSGEELSDLVLDGLAQRLARIVNDALPWWASWIPIPIGMVRDEVDEYFPEIVLDPLKDALDCPDESG